MRHERPEICAGCPCDPKSEKFSGTHLVGEHIPPSGPLDAEILVVGMSGGEEEEELGEPFVGPSGRKLKGALQVMAEGRALRVRKYNLVNCRTKRKGLRGEFINRDPTAKEIRECARRWLLPELLETRALVVPLGQMAYEFLTFFTPEKKNSLPQPKVLSKSGKIAGGLAGTFQQGIGHRILVERTQIAELIQILTPKKKKEKKK